MPVTSNERRDGGTDERLTYSFDPNGSAVEGVVEAVAAASDRAVVAEEPGEEPLPPLYDAIDPEALDRLVGSFDAQRPAGCVTFRYAGYEVTVRAPGVVELVSV